jgi:hypothetical protein
MERRFHRAVGLAPPRQGHHDPRTALSPDRRPKAVAAAGAAAEAPSPDRTIKGNVNRKGERIYHLPGGLDYAKVNISAPGKRWFCTEDEAEAAGE